MRVNKQTGDKPTRGRKNHLAILNKITTAPSYNMIFNFSFPFYIGHKGKVDVHCLQPASGGMYYLDHLPIPGKQLHVGVGMPKNINGKVQHVNHKSTTEFRIGERVRIGNTQMKMF